MCNILSDDKPVSVPTSCHVKKKTFEITETFSQFYQTASLTSDFQPKTNKTCEITDNRAKNPNQKDFHKNPEFLATCEQNLQ